MRTGAHVLTGVITEDAVETVVTNVQVRKSVLLCFARSVHIRNGEVRYCTAIAKFVPDQSVVSVSDQGQVQEVSGAYKQYSIFH